MSTQGACLMSFKRRVGLRGSYVCPAFFALLLLGACGSDASDSPAGTPDGSGGEWSDANSDIAHASDGTPLDVAQTDTSLTDTASVDTGIPDHAVKDVATTESGSHDAGAKDSGGTDGKPCTPFCGSAVCGDNGCNGSCGNCPNKYTCVVNGTCQLDPGSVCGSATCGSAASCCHCNGVPICYPLSGTMTCESLGSGCS